MLVEHLIEQPEDVVAFAEITERIALSGTQTENKKFLLHLSNSLKKQVMRRHTKYWSSLGPFIGHLYVNECIGVQTLYDWLDQMCHRLKSKKGKCTAGRAFLSVMKIVLSKMDSRHPAQSKHYRQQIMNLSDKRRIRPEFSPWIRNLKQTNNNYPTQKQQNDRKRSSSYQTVSTSAQV